MKYKLLLFISLCISISAFSQVEKTVHVATAGTLYSFISDEEANSIENLKITGSIDTRDFKFIRDRFSKLEYLDIIDINIAGYIGDDGSSSYRTEYSPNELPYSSFYNDITNSGNLLLKEVVFPSNIISIADDALRDTNLEVINLPSSLEVIKNTAFRELSISLSELVIPNSVKTLKNGAFSYSKISTLRLGSSLEEIELEVFFYSNIKIIYSLNSVPPVLGGNAFGQNSIEIIYVPATSVSAYKTAKAWDAYYNIIHPL